MKSLLSKDEKTKLLETFRRQGIIIRKAGIDFWRAHEEIKFSSVF